MSFLNPLFLLAAAAVAVPLALHLFHRHESRRVEFPALRYLLRTEKEHARRIRLRQLLLLLVRCAAVVLLALAGARLVVAGQGAAHPPTAVVVILDNSLSSGRVLGDDRVLDRLRAAALAGLAAATDEDRVWVVRAGEPWDIAVPGTAEQARARIRGTEVSAAWGDLGSALRRARTLVADADMPAGEIHLVSDLQASAFAEPAPDAEGPALLVWRGIDLPETANRYLLEPAVGGGLPPLANRRTEISAGLAGGESGRGEVPVRLFVDDRVRGAAAVRPGAAAVFPVGPFPEGWLEGYVEAEPDELRDDDRRWFAVPVRPPPVVARADDPGPFVQSALDVLVDAGRTALGSPGEADVLLSPAGALLDDLPGPARAVVLAPPDPALLPAVNRRLADAGVAWRLRDAPTGGEATVTETRVPVDLETVRVRSRFALEAPAGAEGEVLVRLSDGTPWIVATRGARFPVLLVGSPLDDRASTLPVDAAMVPLVEWIVTGWGAGGTRPATRVGEPLPLPSRATSVELPGGERVDVGGALQLDATRRAGIYRVFAGDSLLLLEAVNPTTRESLLTPLAERDFESRFGPAQVVEDPDRWARETFTNRQGYESWKVLAGAALALLLFETWLAASGGRRARTVSPPLPASP